MFMQCQRACTKIRRDSAENKHEITAQVYGNYPNFEHSTEKNFCYLKSQSEPTAALQMSSQSSRVFDVNN